ncbi:hypothetical protein PMAYCL1PPCAC_16691, partial [Pristionchus mayeri]
ESVLSCRKCRLSRFEVVIRSGNIDDDALLVLSTNRRSVELNIRGIELDPEDACTENYELIPSTYRLFNEATRALIPDLCHFVSAIFAEFDALRNEDKCLLIRNYHRCFLVIDSKLRLIRRFKQGAIYRQLPTYTTYFSLDSLDQFFRDCPDQSNVKAATDMITECFLKHVPVTERHFEQIKPTDDEYMALIGLAFWSVENLELSDDTLLLAARYRTEIIAELMAQYRSTIGHEKAATRIGQLLCLLQDLRRAEMSLNADGEMFRMLGAYDDDTVTYMLQV